jgi:dipeptidase E
MLLTLRSAANPRAAAIMRDSIERNYQRRLADALPGTDTAGRAALLIAICAGVMLDRTLLGHSALNSHDVESLIPYLHAALDAVGKASEQEPAPGQLLNARPRISARLLPIRPVGAGRGRKGSMKLLLTSSGISNASIRDVLVDMLGKPIAECSALFVPTAIYPFPGGADNAFRAISGNAKSPLSDLGWKSVGVLELTALPSIDTEVWVAAVRAADALLVWGGDPVFLAYWMKHSGLADLFPSLRETVYVGVSAGSIAMAARFGETYSDPPRCSGERLSSEDIVFAGPEGDITMTLVMAEGAGLVDFAIIPHVEYDDPLDVANAEKWARRLPVPAYAIDDQTAVAVIDGAVEVVSEGHWKLFSP